MAEYDRQMIADQILEAIENGELPREEIERRLNRIVEEEMSSAISDEADMTKVDMCNSLLWRLYTHGEIGYVDHSEESRREVERKIVKRKQRYKVIQWGLRTAAIMLVLFVGLAMLNIISPIRWFSGESTEDEQQYVIVGHEITTDMVERAIAEHQGEGEMSSNQPEEIVQFIGFDMGFPPMLNDRLASKRYDVLITDYYIKVSCIYEPMDGSQDNSQAVLWKTVYTDIDLAYCVYEQDASGNKMDICGMTVYQYENAGKTNYLWTEGNAIYRLSMQGQITNETECVERIINMEVR